MTKSLVSIVLLTITCLMIATAAELPTDDGIADTIVLSPAEEAATASTNKSIKMTIKDFGASTRGSYCKVFGSEKTLTASDGSKSEVRTFHVPKRCGGRACEWYAHETSDKYRGRHSWKVLSADMKDLTIRMSVSHARLELALAAITPPADISDEDVQKHCSFEVHESGRGEGSCDCSCVNPDDDIVSSVYTGTRGECQLYCSSYPWLAKTRALASCH